MPKHILLPEAELCARYESGQSTAMLAKQYGCCRATITNKLRSAGVVLRSARFRPAAIDTEELRRLYLDLRLPIIEIAARLGVSASTIGNRRRWSKIPLRPRL